MDMRKPEYLSPSAISLWERDPDSYARRYLALNRPEREPQNQAMAIGSAFDARVKAYLYEKLVNKGDAAYALQYLFEQQVEAPLRDWAWKESDLVMKFYTKTGSLGDLLIELTGHIAEPKFETDVLGLVDGRRQIISFGSGAVRSEEVQKVLKYDPPKLLGKPDLYFISSTGELIILDWKVNGFVSPNPTSPMKGYVRCYKLGEPTTRHPDAAVEKVGGIDVNRAMFLEDIKNDWARQLSIYAWLLGSPVGSRIITAIDQICGGPHNTMRVANHRLLVRPETQVKYYCQAADLWYRVTSGHFYTEFDRATSDAKLAMILDNKPQQSVDEIDLLLADLNQTKRWHG
jgi:hypothetical protein